MERIWRWLAALTTVAAITWPSPTVMAAGGTALNTPVEVLELTCYDPRDPELMSPVRTVTQDGTVVELWCGSRIEVSGGHCRVRLGDTLTEVQCVEQAKEK